MKRNRLDGPTGSTPAPSSSPETPEATSLEAPAFESLETGRPERGLPRFTGRVARAIPGAIAGALLIGAIAFGSTANRPDVSDTSAAQAAGGAGGSEAGDGSSSADGADHGYTQNGREGGPDADSGDKATGGGAGDGAGTGDGTGAGDGAGDGAQPTDGHGDGAGDGTEPTAKPDPIEKPEPTSKPNRESMKLVLSLTDGSGVKVDWSRCETDGAVAYKVVRTTDGGVTWPYAGADHQIALVMDLAKTALVDNDAPAGKKLVYRVFCVGGHDGAWTFLNSTPGRAIQVPGAETKPKPEPTPTPQTMSLNLSSAETGGVSISWSTCESDYFSAYKVVRSPDEATDWPLGDNDTLVTYVSDRALTHFVDTGVEAGGHYFYRVFCVKATGDGYKVLNSTHVEDFTVPAN